MGILGVTGRPDSWGELARVGWCRVESGSIPCAAISTQGVLEVVGKNLDALADKVKRRKYVWEMKILQKGDVFLGSF